MPQFDEAFGGTEQGLRARLAIVAGRDPRQLRAQVRDLVRRARGQGQVLDRALPGLRRPARSRPARLDASASSPTASSWCAR